MYWHWQDSSPHHLWSKNYSLEVILLSWLEDDFKDNSNWSCMPWSVCFLRKWWSGLLYQDLAPSMEVWLGMLISPAPLTISFFWWRRTNPHTSWHQKCVIVSKKGQLSRGKNLNPQAGTVACSTVSCSLTRSHFVTWGWIAWWFSSGIALEKDGSYEIHWNPGRLSFTSQDPETYWWDQYDKPHNACPVLKHNHATLVYYYALLEATQI